VIEVLGKALHLTSGSLKPVALSLRSRDDFDAGVFGLNVSTGHDASRMTCSATPPKNQPTESLPTVGHHYDQVGTPSVCSLQNLDARIAHPDFDLVGSFAVDFWRAIHSSLIRAAASILSKRKGTSGPGGVGTI
jgi:hypothetical protein